MTNENCRLPFLEEGRVVGPAPVKDLESIFNKQHSVDFVAFDMLGESGRCSSDEGFEHRQRRTHSDRNPVEGLIAGARMVLHDDVSCPKYHTNGHHAFVGEPFEIDRNRRREIAGPSM
eukprot:scaffold244_cov172-Amphora_coffeaeformis.AAC.43